MVEFGSPARHFAEAGGFVMEQVSISPVPSDEEAVAIVAAVEALWPKPVMMITAEQQRRAAAWRFSGRWWARPVAARRDRPFY